MNYILSYECNTKNNCGYFGYEFSEAYIKQLFSERVRNKLIDAPGTNLLLDEFQDISATGFDKDIVTTHPCVNPIEPTEGINGDPLNAS